MNSAIIFDWIFGTIPILLIAWLVRRVMKAKATELKAAASSVLIAAALGFLIRGFNEGQGGFENRVANVFSLGQLAPTLGSAVIALTLVLLWRLGKLRGSENG